MGWGAVCLAPLHCPPARSPQSSLPTVDGLRLQEGQLGTSTGRTQPDGSAGRGRASQSPPTGWSTTSVWSDHCTLPQLVVLQRSASAWYLTGWGRPEHTHLTGEEADRPGPARGRESQAGSQLGGPLLCLPEDRDTQATEGHGQGSKGCSVSPACPWLPGQARVPRPLVQLSFRGSARPRAHGVSARLPSSSCLLRGPTSEKGSLEQPPARKSRC